MSRQDDLFDATIKLFAEKGYHRTSISDIVEAAGVAQGTFYLYFDSKKAVFIGLLEKFFSFILEAIASVNLNSEDIQTVEDVARQISEIIRQILIIYQANAMLARIFLREAMGLEPEFTGVWESITDQFAQAAVSILDQAIERGILPPQNSLVVAHCIVGMIERTAYFWLFQDNDLELEDVVQAIARFEMLGISGIPSDSMNKTLQPTSTSSD